MTKRIKAEQRKRGRPPTDQRAANLIMELARNNPNLYAKEILKRAKTELGKEGLLPGVRLYAFRLPGLRKAQMLVAEARRPQQKEDPRDAPWSMALLHLPQDEIAQSDRVLLAHSTGRLLEIYRRCLIVGQRFTVRQAIWAARLADALPKADFSPLHSWAYRYASREKTAKALGQPMDTSDLDAKLAFIDMPKEYHAGGTVRNCNNSEYQAAILAGYVKPTVTLSREEQLSAKRASSAQAEERRQGLMTWHDHGTLAWFEQEQLGIIPVTPLAERASNATFGPVPSEWRPRINKENALVLSAANETTIWLRRIAETPVWKAMSGKDQRDTVVKLETLVETNAKLQMRFFGKMGVQTEDASILEKDGIQNHADLIECLGKFGLDPWPGWADRFARKDTEKRANEKGGAP